MTSHSASALILLALMTSIGFRSTALAEGGEARDPRTKSDRFAGREINANYLQAPNCRLKSGPTKLVTRIVDAVTMRLDDGTELRLTGLHPPDPEHTEALAEGDEVSGSELTAINLLKQIALGMAIELKFDNRRRDRYGRVLAHGFVTEGTSRLWLQAELVRQGRVLASSSQGNRACARHLLAIEQRARQSSMGYWGRNIFQLRKAWKSKDLLKYKQTFQIVVGRVRRVSSVKNRIYLNFGRNWKSDFTVVINRRVHKAMKWKPEQFGNLKNKHVRVRGWIEEKNGPIIRLRHPDDLEIIAKGRRYKPQNETPDATSRTGYH